MIEMEAVERKRARGGFLNNLFDWSGKSRKKLFSSNISELSEEPTQEKQDTQNPSKSWLSQNEVDETGKSSSYNLRSDDSSCSASTVTSDDGQGSSQAPSVVARLMGLESLPVSNSVEPRSSPGFDPFFLRSSRKASRWDAYENLGYVNLRTDYDGISWDHLDSRTSKKPIDRFQSETLPPRSAKPMSVTHNRLLSPIRSPGFVQSRNPAHVMEAASKMIQPSPRIAAKARFSSSDLSSSPPISIRDLKEKLKASQKGVISNGTRNNLRGKQDERRTASSLRTQETKNLKGKNSFDGLKGKVKPPPPVSAHLKANTFHKPSSGNRGQKEKMETKNRLKESSVSTGKTVIKPNKQKQKQFAATSVPNQKGSKMMNRVVNKVLVESGTTSKQPGFTATSMEKNTILSSSRKKNLPLNKKPLNGVQEPVIISDKRIKRGEKLIKCGESKTGKDDPKDMDVISFTFSSPIKGLSNKKTDQDTKSALSFNNIDGDSLNILLEQKLRELTSKIESSCSSYTQEEESSGSISKDWVNGTISSPSDDLDKVLSESESVSDCNSFHNNHTVSEAEDHQTSCSKSFSNLPRETELSEDHDWELEYITEIIASNQLMVKELSLGMATDILPLNLFNEIERQRDTRGKMERKTLFDFVNQSLTLKCEKMFMGSCKGMLEKEGILFERKEILAEEVKKEIQRLKKMREYMMDELVDNDMSSVEGNWLDYKRETYEEGVEIEEEIVSDLVDDLVNDLLFCF